MMAWLTTWILLAGGDAPPEVRCAPPPPPPMPAPVQLHRPAPYHGGPAVAADDDGDDVDDDPDTDEGVRIKKDTTAIVLDGTAPPGGADPAHTGRPPLADRSFGPPLFLLLCQLRN